MVRNFDIRPGEQILYIGSYACTRHRANELAELQQKEQLAYLCLDEVDFITGDYIPVSYTHLWDKKKHTSNGWKMNQNCQRKN